MKQKRLQIPDLYRCQQKAHDLFKQEVIEFIPYIKGLLIKAYGENVTFKRRGKIFYDLSSLQLKLIFLIKRHRDITHAYELTLRNRKVALYKQGYGVGIELPADTKKKFETELLNFCKPNKD